jgi:hypothetical protein
VANLADFFNNYLPKKLAEHPEIAAGINGVYLFDLEGAGQWTVDCTNGGSVREGSCEDPGCVVSATGADFEGLLDNPSSGMMLFSTGKLRVTNVGMALNLQKLLS